MGRESKATLGESIFSDIEKSPYLNEIYEGLLYNYALKIFNITEGISMPIEIDDALQFADILSNSVNNSRISQHKIWSQEIVAILRELYPDNPKIDVFMNNIMSNNGNYRGLSIIDGKETELPLLERIYAEVDKANMSIPAEPDKQFFKDQKRVYAHLSDP